jgi:hypothetical protein
MHAVVTRSELSVFCISDVRRRSISRWKWLEPVIKYTWIYCIGVPDLSN